MKTNVFSEELLPACSVNNRADLHSGSVFILSINYVMFIKAAIIREGRRFMSMHRKRWSLLHPSRAVSPHLIPVPCVIPMEKRPWSSSPGCVRDVPVAVHFWS